MSRRVSQQWMDKERIRRIEGLQFRVKRLEEQRAGIPDSFYRTYLAQAIADAEGQIERLTNDYLATGDESRNAVSFTPDPPEEREGVH